jgi:hypothetical protein
MANWPDICVENLILSLCSLADGPNGVFEAAKNPLKIAA